MNMRRMMTDKEIQTVESLRKDGILSLKDAEGNYRFIGNNGSPTEINGITPTYSRWEVSGGHLMLVYAFDTTAEVSLESSQTICSFDVPKWVYDKLIVLWGLDAIELTSCKAVAYSTAFTSFNIVVVKNNNHLDFNNVNQAITIPADRHARIQVDFIVDTNN